MCGSVDTVNPGGHVWSLRKGGGVNKLIERRPYVAKYKVGDKVRILNPIPDNNEPGVTESMEEMAGSVCTIEEVKGIEGYDGACQCYTLEEDRDKWDWAERWLVLAKVVKKRTSKSPALSDSAMEDELRRVHGRTYVKGCGCHRCKDKREKFTETIQTLPPEEVEVKGDEMGLNMVVVKRVEKDDKGKVTKSETIHGPELVDNGDYNALKTKTLMKITEEKKATADEMDNLEVHILTFSRI
jgi:acid stress-induced BolA-like protein IbaG/YrbA